jgi:transposase
LANAYRVKAIPGRKTDQLDSEWLAYLLRAKLIKPSYVPPKVIRELRELTRLRTKYVQNQTQFKNRCQGLLRRVDICLGSRLSDVFGKAGSEILRGLAAGKSVEAILAETKNGWLANREEEILAVARGSLSENDMFILRELTESIVHLEQKIVEVSARIELRVNEHALAIVASVPGVGKGSAASILAEIGDAARFSCGKQIAAWAGLVPSVHQSAGVTVLGRITKRGSKWLRRDMIAVAHCAVNVRGSVFREMFLRVSARHGANTAYTAMARKMLTVIWHLLVCDELYVEEGFSKKPVVLRRRGVVAELSLDDMAGILRNAGYSVASFARVSS